MEVMEKGIPVVDMRMDILVADAVHRAPLREKMSEKNVRHIIVVHLTMVRSLIHRMTEENHWNLPVEPV